MQTILSNIVLHHLALWLGLLSNRFNRFQ